MRFEKKQKNVLHVPAEDAYRALGPRHGDGSRAVREPSRCIPGVFASLQYWDCFDGRVHCLACAKAVKAAWDAGDRYMLDSEESRRAAELVADLAVSKPEAEDLRMALDDLYGTVADVLLGNQRMKDFDILGGLLKALGECLSTEGFAGWAPKSQRRRFMYALPRGLRTPVAYTLMGLYFGTGQTPLLNRERRREFRRLSEDYDTPGVIATDFRINGLKNPLSLCTSEEALAEAERFFGTCLSELSKGVYR